MNLRYILRARKFRTKWDVAEINWIMSNVGIGATCFDIGAHKGGWTYWMRKAVGKGGAIYAFEPQPTLHDYLKGLFRPKHWSNVTLERIAISDHEGEAQVFVPGQAGATSPGASLKQEVLEHEGETFSAPVPTITLDQYVAKNRVTAMAFAKVDVEGSELDVIKGATGVLKEFRPSWIIESESRHIGQDGVRELFTRMTDAGYDGFYFSKDGLRPITEFDFAQHQRDDFDRYWDDPSYCNNFLFTPKG